MNMKHTDYTDLHTLLPFVKQALYPFYFTTDLELLSLTRVSGVLYPPIISLCWSVTSCMYVDHATHVQFLLITFCWHLFTKL